MSTDEKKHAAGKDLLDALRLIEDTGIGTPRRLAAIAQLWNAVKVPKAERCDLDDEAPPSKE